MGGHEAERQALALMNHPCIARVYDAGATPDSPLAGEGGGRPYFVMEYVEGGVPITQFCDTVRLDVPSRLRLFLELLGEVVPDFFMGRTEVSFREYLEFVNAPETLARLARADEKGLVPALADWNEPALQALRPPEPGVDLLPRVFQQRLGFVPLLVKDGERYRLNDDTFPGLDPEWPIFELSVLAGLEYALWLTEKHGGRWRFRLPTDFEWEKAARGADRRRYVWGDYPVYAHCRSKLGSFPRPASQSDRSPVASEPLDESAYGILDLAGSVSEFVITDPARIPIPATQRLCTYRGANWDATDERDYFLASRNRLLPERHARYLGLRLVAEPAAR